MNFMTESSDERPPLKLKLVRRRTTGDEEAHLLVPSQYFIEDESGNKTVLMSLLLSHVIVSLAS